MIRLSHMLKQVSFLCVGGYCLNKPIISSSCMSHRSFKKGIITMLLIQNKKKPLCRTNFLSNAKQSTNKKKKKGVIHTHRDTNKLVSRESREGVCLTSDALSLRSQRRFHPISAIITCTFQIHRCRTTLVHVGS